MINIPFNRPYLVGRELFYISKSVLNSHVSGNGPFTKKCQKYFEQRYLFNKTLLTTSCTDALEMAAMLIDIKPGDEVIIPSYTFVSTALAFVRQGAKIVFADSRADHPGIDEDKIESLITSKTKAIVPVHYAGVSCDMDKIIKIADNNGLYVIEDAAQAIDSYFDGKPLGGIGHLGVFSFHETKNIQCGEGGLLIINDDRFEKRAEILWEKGTNRAEFFRGEVNKYGWVDTGSSFLTSDLVAAFLYAQLEDLSHIQEERRRIWDVYYIGLKPLADKGVFKLPYTPEYATNNAHMFYLVFDSIEKRADFISNMKAKEINPVFHYLSLHESEYYKDKHDGRVLENANKYTEGLVRLPFYVELHESGAEKIVEAILDVFK